MRREYTGKMLSRRLIKILIIIGLALLFQAPSPRDCNAEAFAYVPNSGDNNLSVIKIPDRSDQGVINVGANPYGVAIGDENLYVSNNSDGTVSVIDISDNSVSDLLSAGNSPRGIAVTPDDTYIYVANYSDNSLSIIDTSDKSRISLPVGAGPLGVALNSNDEDLYVTNNSDDSLSIISVSTNELFGTIANHHYINYVNSTDDVAFDKPYGIAMSPDGYYIYVVNNGNNTLSILSDTLIINRDDDFDWADYDPDDDTVGPYHLYMPVTVGNDPRCVVVTPDQTYLYVTNYGDDTVSVISVTDREVTETINVGDGPYGISISLSGVFVYVVNQLDGTISVIDSNSDSDDYNTVIDTIDIGNSPVGFGDFIGGKPPTVPSNLCAKLESTYSIILNWDDNSDDELGFIIFRKKYVAGSYYEIAAVDKDTTTYIDSDLDANANYYYTLTAYNHAGYSVYTDEVYATTGDDTGGCFIATAVYGSPMEPHVKTLRDFRDRFLSTNDPGRFLLRLYYKYSPPLAHYIEYHNTARYVIRWALLPLILSSQLFLSFGPLSVLIILSLSAFIIAGTAIVLKRRVCVSGPCQSRHMA
jgi:YVTN family beta-propeller protein